jgi:hypothetical protein
MPPPPAAQPAMAPSVAPAVVAPQLTPTPAPMPEPFKPFGDDAAVSWTTDTFTLDPDTERYLCFAATLEEDFVINGYEPLIHHLIFARVIGTEREPEALTACDTSYRSNWETVYVSGAGENQLEFPAKA